MLKKSHSFLLLLLIVNFSVFVVALGKSGINSNSFHFILESVFILPLALSLGSLKWKNHFSLYPAYLLGLAHIGALFFWLTFIILTFGMALFIQLLSFGETWSFYPLPLSLILLQDVLWTVLATPFMVSGIINKPLAWRQNLLLPWMILTRIKKLVFLLGVFIYTLFVLIYYLFLLTDYGFVLFIGPPS